MLSNSWAFGGYFIRTEGLYLLLPPNFFLLPQSLLSRVTTASMGSITFSDHAPACVDIDLLPLVPRQWMWRLNDFLLQIPEVMNLMVLRNQLHSLDLDWVKAMIAKCR